ncbi:hypothetical protein HR11_05045 [Porphyromonas macacae]|uniref:M56 family metallopeptidase n=1 Tax=Porphyromonas macacae TaxID=28115 RepID=UPI00052BD779|nr:M56 family metallopeptidase [Porphyromonas macacae]KGN99605.1 hypothetical protein HR11_05045 [Porphyromonas macacae]
MKAFITYLIASGTGLMLFYLIDRYLLQRNTMYSWHRGFYLLAYMGSALLPLAGLLLPDRISVAEVLRIPGFLLDELVFVQHPANGVSSAAELTTFSVIDILFYIWLTGSVYCLCVTSIKLFRLYNTVKDSTVVKDPNGAVAYYIMPEGNTPFSFFRRIYLPLDMTDKPIFKNVLVHETAHIRSLHSLDLLLCLPVILLQWWNPFAHLLLRNMRNNHEFLADRSVLCNGADRKKYQYELLSVSMDATAGYLCCNYQSNNLKKRIMMMNTEKKSSLKLSILRYFTAVLPLFLLLAGSNLLKAGVSSPSLRTESDKPAPVIRQDSTKQVFNYCKVRPSFPGGNNALYQYLAQNIQYPKIAIDNRVEGKIFLSFIVEKDGSLSDIQVLKGNYRELEEKDLKTDKTTQKISPETIKQAEKELNTEAIRIVKSMPKWEPGKDADGKPVRVEFTLPINFKLQ